MYETAQISISKRAFRIYSALLFLYPKWHRHKFGKEMLVVFEDLYREELETKGKIGLGFWVFQFSDITKSVIREHMDAVQKQGMKKYLQNILHLNKYNFIGILFLLPILTVFVIDIVSRIAQGDLFRYNRAAYSFLSHTPLYSFPVLFTWVILFPVFAVLINIIPLLKQLNKKNKQFDWSFIRGNFVTILLLVLGLGFLAMIRLHDFIPCVLHGILSSGIRQFLPLLQYCRNA